MNEGTIIFGAVVGLVSSAVTLLLTAIVNYYKAKLTSEFDMKKLVFQRKTDAAERAMSWCQESIDCYSMLKVACQEADGSSNPITSATFFQSVNQANKLYAESNVRLNPLYLYYDFRIIEEKHNVFLSMQYINAVFVEIGKYEEQAKSLVLSDKNENNQKLKDLKDHSITLLHGLSNAFDDQINSLVEIQEELRMEYKKFK